MLIQAIEMPVFIFVTILIIETGYSTALICSKMNDNL